MKKFKFNLLAGLLLLISASVCAQNAPEKVQEAFKKMYPKVTTVEWEHKGDYHIVGFVSDSHDMNVWFGNNARWIMTETNVESLEEVPAPIAKAFMQTETPPIQIRYIKIITFPKMPTVVIIDIEEYNSNREIQLFYAPDGKLLQSLDVSGGDGEIYPELFGYIKFLPNRKQLHKTVCYLLK